MASREIEKRRRHAARDLSRKKASKAPLPTILIVCEGENTEPSYFRQLRCTSVTIKPVGEGYNTISLVERAQELSRNGEYDEIWCVFDKDDYHIYQFNNAIMKAERLGFNVAYSNQSFEYWLLLHLIDHQGGALHRNRYNKLINRELGKYGVTYDGDGCKIVTKEFFDLLFSEDPTTKTSRHLLAIQRAKRIYSRLDHHSPAGEESSTTVHLLLQHLISFELY